jgi:2-aminoethylphosphonate-pyruvate transaminase
MLRDWGSWDADFNRITARVRERLLDIVHARESHECVPLQGSGTFSVEAAIGTLVPRGGHVLVPQNGAYCQRIARICRVLGRALTTIDYAEDAAVRAEDIDQALAANPAITHRVAHRGAEVTPAASSIRCGRSPRIVARFVAGSQTVDATQAH